MKKVIRLTESDLKRLIKRVIKEANSGLPFEDIMDCPGVKTAMGISSCKDIAETILKGEQPNFMKMGLCSSQLMTKSTNIMTEFMEKGIPCIQEKLKQLPMSF
jgi:hypothetical protein